MVIDLSPLINLARHNAKENATTAGNLARKPTAPAENTGILTRLDREKKERDRVRRIYETYQENTRRAGTLRSDITKGIQRGEDPLALLLKAVECISLMTGNTAMYSQNKETILNVYGWGMGQPAPLQQELEETRQRLARLTRSEQEYTYTDTHTHECIQQAINAHMEQVKILERELLKHERHP